MLCHGRLTGWRSPQRSAASCGRRPSEPSRRPGSQSHNRPPYTDLRPGRQAPQERTFVPKWEIRPEGFSKVALRRETCYNEGTKLLAVARRARPHGNVDMVAESVLSEATRRLVEQFHPRRVILFGSQARGTGDDRSDVDLLVICEVGDNRRALMVAMDRCLWGLPIARDIVVLTPEEFERDREIPGTIARPAAKEGRILYDGCRTVL